MSGDIYKVETKPTIWDVQLVHGCYSDRSESHYYIRANDRDEAWFLFKKYWPTAHGGYNACLILEGDERGQLETFVPENWNVGGYDFSEPDDEPDLDPDYGDASRVIISGLNVIEFKS